MSRSAERIDPRALSAAQRAELGTQVRDAYAKGTPIRTIADHHSVSYGFVHGLLREAGVTMRGRGGANRKPLVP